MKNTSLTFTFLLCLILFPAYKVEKQPAGALEEYVEAIEGVWLSEERPELAPESGELFRLEFRREWIYRNQVWVKFNLYCQPGRIDFLAFELRDNKLQYVGAVLDKETYPLMYLDFAEILYEKEEGRKVLYYESAEAECENHLNLRFHRVNPTPTSLL